MREHAEVEDLETKKGAGIRMDQNWIKKVGKIVHCNRVGVGGGATSHRGKQVKTANGRTNGSHLAKCGDREVRKIVGGGS